MIRLFCLFCLFLTVFFSSGQIKPVSQPLKEQIQKLKEDPKMAHASLSIHIYDLTNHALVYQYNDQQALTPASCLKIVTTSAALGMLGEDFKFETKIGYIGNLMNGTIHGNLLIQGGGDPTLGSGRVEGSIEYQLLTDQWIRQIKDKGIFKIDGSVIIDASFFEKQSTPDGWQWGDIGNYFGSAANGFNFNENYYKLYFQPGNTIGARPGILKHEPLCPGLTFDNAVKTAVAGTGDNAYIYGAPYSVNRYVKGTIPMGTAAFTIKGAMPDPAAAFGLYFSTKLMKAGLLDSISYEVVYDEMMPAAAQSIFVYKSPPLKDIVKHTNQRSINLYAEAMLKMLGKKVYGKGTTEDGVKAVISYWQKLGMPGDGLYMYDGSGLAPGNSITAAQMAFIIRKINGLPYNKAFEASLPVAGVSGTLSKLCKGTSAEFNLKAKSGNINRVTTYAGYVDTKALNRLSFVLMAQNYEGENAEMISKFEEIMIKMSEIK